jgi:hypothetical protein
VMMTDGRRDNLVLLRLFPVASSNKRRSFRRFVPRRKPIRSDFGHIICDKGLRREARIRTARGWNRCVGGVHRRRGDKE